MSAADFAFAVWETFYITVLSTAFALVLGLPLGVLLVAGDKDGVLPLPAWLMHALNFVINILRSIPFLILMICVFPLSRLIIGTTVVNILEEIRRLISFGIPEESAIKCSTINPAKATRMDDLVGSISVGKYADLLVLNEDYTPAMVYRDGKPQRI